MNGEPLHGRRVLVTGAAGGIGRDVARDLAALGAEVVVTARDARRADAVASELGGGAAGLRLDVADHASIAEAVATLRERYDRLDALVNNAGVLMSKRETDPDGIERTWATNLLGPFLLTRALEPFLRASDEPRAVMVGSVAQRYRRAIDWDDPQFARGRYSGGAAYAQSKLGLLMMTRAYSRRAPWLALSCVHPGTIATGIFRRMPFPIGAILGRVLPPATAGARPIVRLVVDPACALVRGSFYDRERLEEPPSRVRLSDDDEDRLWALLETQAARTANAANDGSS